MINLKRLSQTTFVLGILMAAGALGYTFYLNRVSPPGFCPINPARPFMWIGVVMLVSSLVIDWKISRDNKAKN